MVNYSDGWMVNVPEWLMVNDGYWWFMIMINDRYDNCNDFFEMVCPLIGKGGTILVAIANG